MNLAIGDMPFKLPPIFTERVLALATPPFHENYKIGQLITRDRTPPYLSNRAEVKYVDLATAGPNLMPILILCSDGLCDLYNRRSSISDLPKDVQLWLTTFPVECGRNLALELLWDALGGDGGVKAATKIVRGMPGRRIDDTTVVVNQL
jgi:pyruvate dehydrogenase phosphatase